MRRLDDVGKLLCEYQKDLFEFSFDHTDCSSFIFIKEFCFSSLSKLMDKDEFITSSIDVPNALEILEKEKGLKAGSTKISPAILGWIGYLYRYWSYTREISTKSIYKKAKPNLLYGLYEAYHSMDVEEAVVRIEESKS